MGLMLHRRGVLSSAAAAAFTPADLFASGEDGAWYDPSDLSTMYTDDGVTNVTSDGEAVYRIDDKSGNGYHLKQATASKRPIYKTDGTFHWLLGDGSNDRMTVAFGANKSHPITAVVGADVPTGNSFRRMFDADGGSSARRLLIGTQSTSSMLAFAGTTNLEVSGYTFPLPATVWSTLFNTTSSVFREDGTEIASGDVGSNTPGGISLFASYSDSEYFNGKIFGLIYVIADKSASFSDMETWMDGKMP